MFLWISLSSVLKYMNQQKKENKFYKKEARYTEWQLPQLLAGILIKTKLVSFSEQTWQALSRRAFFFHSCQNIKWVQVLQECLQGWGQGWADLFLSPLCMWVSICVFIYVFEHVFPPNPDCFHACFGSTAQKYTQQFAFAPFCSFDVLESWAKASDCYVIVERLGTALSRTICKGPGNS